MTRQPFPWREAMAFGFGVLRISSAHFWSMTPRELACAIEAVRGGHEAAMRRPTLDHLMKSYPDERKHS